MDQPRKRLTLSRAQLPDVLADAVPGRCPPGEVCMHAPSRTKHPDELLALEFVALTQIVLQPLWPPAVYLAHKNLQERLNFLGRFGWQLLDEKHGSG